MEECETVARVRRQPYSILSSKKNADKWRKKVCYNFCVAWSNI